MSCKCCCNCEKKDPFRQTGRTTLLHAEYVLTALSNPGKAIRIKDHYDRVFANMALLIAISDTLKHLRVPHEAHGGNLTITVTPIKRNHS